ncbi:beta-galactosidase [Mycetocola zhadangensis]|uniref:beta-galactosidase n=1 Tax=Mycetocola zhadangensis TaxID=1164595 RepID=UPI003A4E4C11
MPRVSQLQTATFQPRKTALSRPEMTNQVDHSEHIRLTNHFVEIDGVPTVPVSGEIHYSRIPRDSWEERLRLMKAGGITVVATYIFWIHHEEQRGQIRFDDNRDVAAFVELCAQVGLDVVLRVGPWCHGEVRNGGFPDWVQASGAELRTDDPAYLELVRTWFGALGDQLAPLCTTDRPVIGIQLENELYDQPGHIRTLKQLAREAGLHAPVWTATAWGSADLPTGEVLPLYGGYGDGFWVDANSPWDPTFRAHYFFSHTWDDPGIGADLRNVAVDEAVGSEALIGTVFPPATCEIGGGMATAYHRRPRPSALDIATVAQIKLGNGSAWQGYYMFAGGTNPAGTSGMQESHATGYPNDLPRFDYDFAAPISASGQLAPSFAALRSQHAFLAAFGASLAAMPSSLPDVRPRDIDDITTLRWALRTDGASGVVFLGWHQPHLPLPTAQGVQFRIDLGTDSLTFPPKPIDIPSGTLARWPLNFPVGAERLDWATASLLTLLTPGGHPPTLVLQAEHGVPVDFAIADDVPVAMAPGSTGSLQRFGDFWRLDSTDCVTLTLNDGSATILVLPAARAADVWVLDTPRGREIVLSAEPIWTDTDGLAARSSHHPMVQRYVPQQRSFAPVVFAAHNGPAPFTAEALVAKLTQAPPPPAGYGSVSGRQSAPNLENSRTSTYRLEFPEALQPQEGANLVLTLRWEGDVARLAVDGTVVADRFWDGSDWTVLLPPLSADTVLTIDVIPLSPDSSIHVPADAERRRRATSGALDGISRALLTRSVVWSEAR